MPSATTPAGARSSQFVPSTVRPGASAHRPLHSAAGVESPRHRRRRVHRLGARATARRAGRRRSRLRQPLDRERRPAGRHRRGAGSRATSATSSRSSGPPSGREIVFHLAAGTGVLPSIENPLADFDLNARGTLAALWAARQAGAGRFVFSSSNAPLGAGAYPASEEKPVAPLSPYGASKATGEAYCSAFHGAYGLGAVAVRFSNAYGPRSAHKGNVIPLFLRRLLEGRELVVYGDGEQTRDFVYVEDLADGLARAAEVEGIGGEIFQLASGVETSLNDAGLPARRGHGARGEGQARAGPAR